jgi:D-alanyl-D-alanine carboxypeptidase
MRRPGLPCARAASAILIAVVACLAGVAPATSQELPPPQATIVVDAGSGVVLAGTNIHTAYPPASLTKIMTALVAAERLPADATVPVSELAASMPAMRIDMHAGEVWTLDQAMASLMMVSANDAAYALAERVGGGSVDGFATAANATAKRLGMKDSTLGDPAGLDDEMSYEGGPTMSAYDLAVLTRNALALPEVTKYAGLPEHQFTDPTGKQRWLTNHNKLVDDGGYAYAGATGFKTGFTKRANHTLVATATRDGRTCIAVLLGAVDLGYGTAAGLLDSCFAAPANSKGTGDVLPDVAVSPYDSRVADRDAFAVLAGAPVAGTAASDGTTPTSLTLESAPVAAKEPETTAAAADDSGDGGGGGGGLFRLRNLVLVLLVVAVTLFFLRRRAVRRQRARRIARQRSRAAQMRSGGLPVVDGRYRPGTRVGKPLESHVRVRRMGDGS